MVRYAVVGLGNISQVALLPAFEQASESSQVVALLSSDAEKRERLSKRYQTVECVGGYEDLERILEVCEVDAVYLGVPNSLHREMVERIARLGVHVLCEKPMAMTVEDCRAMIDVAEDNDVKLRFPEDRIAQLTASQGVSSVSSYRVVGTAGSVRVEPAYGYEHGLARVINTKDGEDREQYPKRDQFPPELLYFSRCILENEEPEPSGEEGLADVRVMQAAIASARSGSPVRAEPLARRQRPTVDQLIRRPGIEEPEPIHAPSPSTD